MLPYAEPTKAIPEKRPTISEVVKGPTGTSSFTVTFLPGQELPTHRNASRILIHVLSGEGSITIDSGEASRLIPGTVVQVGSHVSHALCASAAGLQVEVHLVADCCASC